MKNSTQSEQTNPEVTRKLEMVLSTVKKALKQIRQESVVEKTSYIQRISLNLEYNKMQIMLTNLSKGYLVKKHSPSTTQYHEKYLYISQDHRFLCWKSLDKNDQKMIQLRKIDAVLIGLDCKGMIESKTITDVQRCFVVMSDVRNLQIQCNNYDQLFQITIQLQQALKNSKRMHLSYRF